MESSETADTELQVRLSQYPFGDGPMCMRVQYAAQEPYAVRAAFYRADSPSATVEWVLSRDLLVEGLQLHAGHGDVRVWPAPGGKPDVLYIALGRARETVLIEASYQEVELFLGRTQSLVPMGTEHERFDLDAELACLLSRS